MKQIFLIMFLTMTITSFCQSNKLSDSKAPAPPDLKTEINQTSFDKILSSMDIPLILFEHKNPFPRSLAPSDQISKFNDEFDKIFGYDDMQSLFSWAVNGESTRMADVSDVELKNELINQWRMSMEPINEVIANYEFAVKNQSVPGYTGPLPSDFEKGDISIVTLKKWQKSSVKDILTDFTKLATTKVDFLRAHLAYAKAELYDRPSLTVNSPNFKTSNIKVKVSATGELWTKILRFRCCLRIGGICVMVCPDGWEWIKVASISPSVKIGSDVTVNFEIQNLKIFAEGSFDRLFLDYFILREINLAAIGNIYLKKKKFELYDVSKFVASLPYINKEFRIQDIKLPPRSNGVAIEINIISQ